MHTQRIDHIDGEERYAYYERVFQQHMAQGWDTAPGKEVILNAIARIRNRLPAIGTCVDIGCGTGLLLQRIHDEIFPDWSFCGVDFSHTAIDQAKLAHPRMKFLAEDGSETSLPTACADVVVSYGSYEHFPSPNAGILELARLLKPSGVFFALIPTIEGYWGEAGKEVGWYADKSGQPQWNFPRSQWEAMFKEAGLLLWPHSVVEGFGARNPDVFFMGSVIR